MTIHSVTIKADNLLLSDGLKSKYQFKDSPLMGNIFVEDAEVTTGKEVVDYIKANNEDTFLVSKGAYDYLSSKGVKNVCMFDFKKADRTGQFPIQGGLIFP